MSDEKLYRIKTKEGAHVNTKVNEDGSRAALQFDDNNDLKGPVDLIEVDEDEYTREVIVEVERERRGIGEAIIEDAVLPAVENAIVDIIEKSVDAAFAAIGKLMSEKVIPAAKRKGAQIISEAKSKIDEKKLKEKTSELTIEANVSRTNKNDDASEAKYHSAEEVDTIIENMKVAALYLAAGIKELSNTIIVDDELDEDTRLKMQNELGKLTTGEVTAMIDMLLEEKNQGYLDAATIRLFSEFKKGNFIVGEKVVPISNYIEYSVKNS